MGILICFEAAADTDVTVAIGGLGGELFMREAPVAINFMRRSIIAQDKSSQKTNTKG